jgi:hypothetical protein
MHLTIYQLRLFRILRGGYFCQVPNGKWVRVSKSLHGITMYLHPNTPNEVYV